jgi:hypothetical protein
VTKLAPHARLLQLEGGKMQWEPVGLGLVRSKKNNR